jgi:hypothetical protein
MAPLLFQACNCNLGLRLKHYTVSYTPFVPKYKMFQPIIAMYVCNNLLVCKLKAKGMNLYTKKHLDTCVTMMG